MKRRKTKRLLAGLLALVMALSLCEITLGQSTPAKAAVSLQNPTTDGNGVTTCDCIYFGNYYQSNSSTKEPIKWRVLSVNGNDAFLLADQNLDAKPYNEEDTDVTWATCTLRTWLNDAFLNTAFTSAEQAAIKNTTVVNDDNPYYGTEGGENTTDKVYLLSIAETSNTAYGFNGEFNTSSNTREAKNTAYAKECGAWTSTWASVRTEYKGNGDWWLRSPGDYSFDASSVNYFGYGGNYGSSVYHDDKAVRPALHLNLSSSTLWSYAGKVTSEGGGGSSQETPKPAATEPPVVSDRDESLGTDTKGADLSLGSNKSGKLSAEVSEFFPANWSLGASVFPVTLSQIAKADGSYSVKMAIGVGITNMLDSKTEWSRYKQVVNDAEKYASLNGLLYRYATVNRSTYSVSKFNKMPSLSVVGYMEQEYDKYGNLISSTG